jgi:hypothetical protein
VASAEASVEGRLEAAPPPVSWCEFDGYQAFLDSLSEEQRLAFQRGEPMTVKGGESQLAYVIDEHGRVRGGKRGSYCIDLRPTPSRNVVYGWEAIWAKKQLIEADEERFLRTAG